MRVLQTLPLATWVRRQLSLEFGDWSLEFATRNHGTAQEQAEVPSLLGVWACYDRPAALL